MMTEQEQIDAFIESPAELDLLKQIADLKARIAELEKPAPLGKQPIAYQCGETLSFHRGAAELAHKRCEYLPVVPLYPLSEEEVKCLTTHMASSGN